MQTQARMVSRTVSGTMNKRKQEGIGLTATAKGLVGIAAIGHLIFTSIHVKALLLLENEICGFIMFLFVLFGLVALFEATRIREGRILEKLFTAIVCGVTSGMGLMLVNIYRSAIANQRGLEPALVTKAVGFSMVVIAIYVVACVLLLIDIVKNRG